jgi:hypothetical protein
MGLRESIVDQEPRIVAVALLTTDELEALGPTFDRAYSINEAPCTGRLLAAIDEADRAFWREQDKYR